MLVFSLSSNWTDLLQVISLQELLWLNSNNDDNLFTLVFIQSQNSLTQSYTTAISCPRTSRSPKVELFSKDNTIFISENTQPRERRMLAICF